MQAKSIIENSSEEIKASTEQSITGEFTVTLTVVFCVVIKKINEPAS